MRQAFVWAGAARALVVARRASGTTTFFIAILRGPARKPSPRYHVFMRTCLVLALSFVASACHRAAPPAPVVPAAAAATARSQEELGSLRNARGALPRAGERSTLPSVAMDLSEPERRALERVAPHARVLTRLPREPA